MTGRNLKGNPQQIPKQSQMLRREAGKDRERLLYVVCELFAVGNVCLSCSRKRTRVILAQSVHKPRGAYCVTASAGAACILSSP